MSAGTLTVGSRERWMDRLHALVPGDASAMFRGLVWFIGLVSLYDALLVVIWKGEILYMEENLLCWYLIKLDPGSLSFFLPAKATGTTLVLLALHAIRAHAPIHGMLVTGGVAAFQMILLGYLHA